MTPNPHNPDMDGKEVARIVYGPGPNRTADDFYLALEEGVAFHHAGGGRPENTSSACLLQMIGGRLLLRYETGKRSYTFYRPTGEQVSVIRDAWMKSQRVSAAFEVLEEQKIG